MEMQELFDKVKVLIDNQATLHAKAIEEQKQFGKATSEKLVILDKLEADTTKYTNAYTELKTASDELAKKQKEIEAKQIDFERGGLRGGVEVQKSLGERFIESDVFKEMIANRDRISRKFEAGGLLPSHEQKDILSANTGSVLVDPTRLSGITQIPNVPLTVRALIPIGRTNASSIQFVKENVFTNQAGPQYSPSSPSTFDSAKKNKSDLSWTLVTANVTTLGHYMKASRQILDDAPMLQSEINNRLLYGLALEEEEQLLNGDGTNGNLNGLIPQAADYDTALNVSGDTKIDKIAHALLQVMLAKFMPTAVVLAPKDWHDIQLIKTEERAANTGSYVFSNPAAQTEPRIWGYRVVPSLSMTAGRFLVGNFATGAQIFDRMNATVEVARQNEDDFVRNMVSILAELREALAVYSNASFVEGGF